MSYAYVENGTLVTTSISDEYGATHIQTEATVPSGTVAEVIVKQDTDGDGGAENTELVSIDDGSNEYSLSNFTETDSDYWTDFTLETDSGQDGTPQIDRVEVIFSVPPKNVSAAAPDSDTIDLSWDVVSSANSYAIYRAESSGTSLSDYSQIDTTSSTSYSDTGRTDGTRYHYRVTSILDRGESDPSPEVTAQTPLPSPTLDSVTAGYREVTVDWTLNDDNPDGDVIVYRDGESVATISDLSTTSYTDSGLLDGEEYSYYVERATPDASESSGSLSDVTDLPAPTDLSADAVTSTSVDLSWTSNHNYGDTRVEFREADASSWVTDVTVDYTTEAETISTLLNGEQYDARVVAETEHTSTEDQ